jgi:hypothetical protein
MVRNSGTVNDSGEFPTQQVEAEDVAHDSVPWFPYGYSASPPVDQLSVRLNIEAEPDNRIHLPGSPFQRIRNQAPGTVSIHSPVTGSRVTWNPDGSIEVVGGLATVSIVAENVTVEAPTVSIEATTSVTIDSPSATFTGDVQVDGDLTVDSDTTLGANVTSNSKDISDTHTHGGGTYRTLVDNEALINSSGVPD